MLARECLGPRSAGYTGREETWRSVSPVGECAQWTRRQPDAPCSRRHGCGPHGTPSTPPQCFLCVYPDDLLLAELRHPTRASVVDLLLRGAVIVGGFWFITNAKARERFRQGYLRTRGSKHPQIAFVNVLIIAPFYPLIAIIAGIVLLLTNSLVLAALSAGGLLALKIAVALAAWIWSSLVGNLPAMGFGYVVSRVVGRLRSRRTKQEQQ
jgi:hypothetical protein